MTNILEMAKAFEANAKRDSAAISAIEFALDADEGMVFLRCWIQGDFDVIRKEWPEAPEAVFIGADPFYKPAQ
ncbi:hypothetical protein [Kushneria indalinina]|uniref:Uncharacterized protein n=1 Tax=Kushneria indalinina DSM 14324 TaxID=1122140 RepID=A0A3D9DRG2_9GAMM|nr:hypothetical protein [Kushneria indalinina]REC93313.1 hypothetical protein C8D72_3469 [Kushneria indalinina DSM 14324]